MMRKLLFLLLLVISTGALAQNFTDNGINFTVTDPTNFKVAVASNTGFTGVANIPATVTYNSQSYDVISIGANAFSNCTGLISVTIPNSVISLGNRAFQGCLAISTINIPNSVTSIGGIAFRNCGGLVTVTIPSSVTSIGSFAFDSCTALTTVNCNILTPLVINTEFFRDVNRPACALNVPASSAAAYDAASIWTDFNINQQTPATHLNFDGVDGYVNCGVNPAYDFTTGTIEAWIKPNSFSDNKAIISLRTDTGNARWSLHVNEGNNTLGIFNGFGFNTIAANIDPNQWYHVAFVMNTTQTEVYLNGVSVGIINLGINTTSTGNQLLIGFPELNNFPNERFSGSIDDVRIWNVERTATQIAASKNCELQGTEAGLITYYKFNQGFDATNNTAITSATATTGSNGTLTNFALTGATSNWLAGSPVTTGSTIPNAPTAFTQTLCGVNTANNLVPAISATIKWYTSETTTTPLVATDVVTTGIYYVAAVNANGCESTRTLVYIYVSATPIVANLTITNSTCGLNNGSASVAPTGGTPPYNFLWSDGSIQASRNNLSPGNYWYLVTDSNGCNTQETYFTISNILPTAPTAVAQSFCGTTTASSLVPAISATIKWYTDNTTTTALTVNDVITSGTYYVAEALTGCESIRTSVAITVSTIPNAPTGLFNTPAGACFGATASDLRPEISSTIKWYASATATTALAPTDVVTTGTYYAAAVNANGCESTRTPLSILVNTTPVVANFTLINSTCGLNNGSASVAPTGGGGTPYPYSILWSNGQTGNSINNLTPGNYSYLITDSNGCTTPWINFTISNILPTAPTVLPQSFCGATTASSLLPAISATIKWYANDTTTTALTTTDAITTGTYYVSETLNGCESTRTSVAISLADTTNPTAIAQNINVLLNDSGTITVTPSMINNGSSDNCSIAAIQINNASNVTFTCANIGDNNVVLQVIDGSGNVATANAVVNVIDVISPTAIAQNITVTLDSSGTITVTPSMINNGSSDNCAIVAIQISNATFTCANIGANNVVLQVIDVSGNVATANAVVTVNSLNATTITNTNDTLTATEAGATNYQWMTCNGGNYVNIVGQNNQSYTAVATGSYAVDITKNGCTTRSECFNVATLSSDSFEFNSKVNIFPNPSTGIFTISIQEDASISVNDMLGKVIYTNKVKAGNNTIDISNYQAGIYLLNISNENGSVTKKIIKE